MSKILVTGGAGFISSHVIEELVGRGHDVVVLDDLSGGFIDNIVPGTRFVEGSINNPDAINQLFQREQFDYVYHLAVYAAEGLSHFIKRFNYNNNLIGSSPEFPMTEETAPHLEDSYGIAKLAVEHELAACKAMFGLDYIIFRPNNVYQVFNIGADEPYSGNDLAIAVSRAIGVPPDIEHVPARNEVQHAYSSNAKVQKVFGERTLHSLDEALGNMALWVQKHGLRASRTFDAIEITKNFPMAWLT
jgi:UDP-glucose 4-epimerase